MYKITVGNSSFEIHTEKLAKVAVAALAAEKVSATYVNLRVLKPKAIKTPSAKQLEAARALIAAAEATPVAEAPVVAKPKAKKAARPVATPALVS
jgi:hypothetical protein